MSATINELLMRQGAFLGGGVDPKGFQQITDLSSSTALTVPVGSVAAIIEAEDQNVRWRDDGTAPTATVGMTLAAGDTLIYTGDLATIRLIEETASAKANISYYGGIV